MNLPLQAMHYPKESESESESESKSKSKSKGEREREREFWGRNDLLFGVTQQTSKRRTIKDDKGKKKLNKITFTALVKR